MEAALDAPTAELAAKGDIGRKRVLQMHNAERNSAALLEIIKEISETISGGRPF
jgi:hypothetical protein